MNVEPRRYTITLRPVPDYRLRAMVVSTLAVCVVVVVASSVVAGAVWLALRMGLVPQ